MNNVEKNLFCTNFLCLPHKIYFENLHVLSDLPQLLMPARLLLVQDLGVKNMLCPPKPPCTELPNSEIGQWPVKVLAKTRTF